MAGKGCSFLPLFFLIVLPICVNSLVKSGNPYTSKELKAISQFRPLVEQHLTLDFQRSNAYLLRWLRISNFVVSDAVDELRKVHQRRNKNKMDSILDEPAPRDLPYTVDGVDKAGRPILVFPFGNKWILRKYALAGKQDVAIRQYQRMLETGLRSAFEVAESQGRDIDQYYFIADIQGYSLRAQACLSCLPIMTEMIRDMASADWPFVKNLTVINAPRIFDPILSLGRSIITKLPLYSFDSNKSVWKEALLKEIDEDQLPPVYGGTRRVAAPGKSKLMKPTN